MRDWAWRFCNKVWRGKGWPEIWKERVVPIFKKKEGEVMSDYRGVTLMPTLYKMYAAVLAEKLRNEVVEGGMIPQNQTGFRKRMGAIDNIFVLNYAVNKQIRKKGGELITLFIDLRAAFDLVDRGVRVRL